MAYYYINSNYQDYPVNYPYYNQPYYSDHHSNHNYYSSSSYDDQYGYGGYSNEQYPRYDQNHYHNTQFHSNTYRHIPSQSLIVYQYTSAYDHSESSPKQGSNFIDPISTTGFAVSYSNAQTDPKTDLGFEEYNPEPFQGGYDMSETYGKPLPPSEEICYPPSKSDPTPPPPSPYGKGKHNLDTPPLKDQEKTLEDDEDQASELDEDEEDDHDGSEDDDDDGEEEEQEEEEEGNHGVLIAPPLPGKEDQSIDQGGTKPANGNHGGSIAPPLPGKEDQSIDQGSEKPANGSFVNEQAREEEDASKAEQEEEEEQQQQQEKRVHKIPPGYALEALDLCEGVFGGYFPCLRKRNQGNAGDQEGSSGTVTAGNEDADGDCWKTTMDYLFGDPDPYARAMPDPIYGYQRYYPQQPICGQVEYGGGNYTWSDNPSYYGHNGGGTTGDISRT
ncbi:hypothetical protein Cgig2_004278 [Carnegiea gigantea]|uniref:Uncharacterized protein n=1 Tax=Carnegiea gigantea TaxID=171969 RepID=A0A9Q1KHR7_9CARY|nr:hypothetical protein Cgig2_004278 [Carnegiea gigantea]